MAKWIAELTALQAIALSSVLKSTDTDRPILAYFMENSNLKKTDIEDEDIEAEEEEQEFWKGKDSLGNRSQKPTEI